MRKSELSKWGLNELCCKRTVNRWKALELNFPLMYGTGTLQPEQKLLSLGVIWVGGRHQRHRCMQSVLQNIAYAES